MCGRENTTRGNQHADKTFGRADRRADQKEIVKNRRGSNRGAGSWAITEQQKERVAAITRWFTPVAAPMQNALAKREPWQR